jgi:hypothetical protein
MRYASTYQLDLFQPSHNLVEVFILKQVPYALYPAIIHGGPDMAIAEVYQYAILSHV